jgi:ligand-binding SRPBCC domain-containing protein
MNYHHRFRVPVSIEQVAEFHAHSASMAAITPPPIVVKVQRAPAVLADGDEMAFTMWLGLPILFAYRAWKTRRILQ